uniref:AB hydrolase-1 domain-containing protein n=1 Tax=Aegilops tauschii subsp. strangulata TaxID=200361 RepID=A0A453AMM8_AEGTS
TVVDDLKAFMTGRTTRLILAHGTGHSGWCWYKVATLLRVAGHCVDASDLAACGANARRLRNTPTFEDYTRPLLDALRDFPDGERAVEVDHNFGGMSIMLASEEFPDKVAAAVFVTAFMPDCASPRSRRKKRDDVGVWGPHV